MRAVSSVCWPIPASDETALMQVTPYGEATAMSKYVERPGSRSASPTTGQAFRQANGLANHHIGLPAIVVRQPIRGRGTSLPMSRRACRVAVLVTVLAIASVPSSSFLANPLAQPSTPVTANWPNPLGPATDPIPDSANLLSPVSL